jgi:hypothetical protein
MNCAAGARAPGRTENDRARIPKSPHCGAGSTVGPDLAECPPSRVDGDRASGPPWSTRALTGGRLPHPPTRPTMAPTRTH